MHVQGPGKLIPASNIRKKRGAGGAGEFDSLLDSAGNASEASGEAGVSALPNLNPLLALQEVVTPGVSDREAYRRGENLLELLDGLRDALLEGTLSLGQLHQLERAAAQIQQQEFDPRLREILSEIELRAAVEAAKWGR